MLLDNIRYDTIRFDIVRLRFRFYSGVDKREESHTQREREREKERERARERESGRKAGASLQNVSARAKRHLVGVLQLDDSSSLSAWGCPRGRGR